MISIHIILLHTDRHTDLSLEVVVQAISLTTNWGELTKVSDCNYTNEDNSWIRRLNVYLCMCICVCVCVCVCDVYVFVYVYVCMYVYVYVWICMDIYGYVYVRVYVFVCICVFRVGVCVCVCVCFMFMYARVHAFMRPHTQWPIILFSFCKWKEICVRHLRMVT